LIFERRYTPEYNGEPESPLFQINNYSHCSDDLDEENVANLISSKQYKKLMKNKVKVSMKDPLKEYVISSRLGDGGSVFRATNKKTGQEVALKRVKFQEKDQKTQILNEISILQLSKHENIIECYKAFEYKSEI